MIILLTTVALIIGVVGGFVVGMTKLINTIDKSQLL
jgi:uncharacterized protein YneF (UPF0154 family)